MKTNQIENISGFNRQTVARQIRFATTRLVGDQAWTVVGMFGNVLACLELGDDQGASWSYERAKEYLRSMIKRRQYLPKQKSF